MKKIIAIILAFVFLSLNVVQASDYYNYLTSDYSNSSNNSVSNVVVIPEGYNKIGTENYTKSDANTYNGDVNYSSGYIDDVEITEDYYKGSVKYIPTVVTTTASKTTVTNSSPQTTQKEDKSFSENHPILTGLGVGVLLAGMVAVALIDDSDDYDCHGHKRPHDKYNHKNSCHNCGCHCY